MRLLQLFRRAPSATQLTRRLWSLAADPRTDADQLRQAIDEARAARLQSPTHAGLAYALGLAGERLASLLAWDDRTPELQQAVAHYRDALRLVTEGAVEGAELIAECAPTTGSHPGPVHERARRVIALQLGILLTVDYRVRDPASAVELLESVLSTVPPPDPAWYYLGEAYLLLGRFDDAERVWTAALAAAPDDPSLQSVLRNLPVDRLHHAIRAGDWPAVLREARRVPSGAMPASELWTLQGDAYLALGDAERARQCWMAALAADPRTLGVRRRLRRLERGEIDRALQAVRLEPRRRRAGARQDLEPRLTDDG